MIPKEGCDPTIPKGYRPISLLPTTSKVLESFIGKEIAKEAKLIGAIIPTQFGAIADHNTVDTLLEITDVAMENLNTRRKTSYFKIKKFFTAHQFSLLLQDIASVFNSTDTKRLISIM